MINIYKERKSKMKHITQFFAAVLVILAFILLSSSTSSLLKISPSSSTCLVSFGDYHGHKYHSVGTVGQGKCLVQSKWMRVMQHTVKLDGDDTSLIDDWLFIDYHDRINVLVEDPKSSKKTRK